MNDNAMNLRTNSLFTAVFLFFAVWVVAEIPISARSSAELVQMLLTPATRDLAYHELSRRTDPEVEDFVDFMNKHRNPEVIVCPQSGQRRPVYAVLSDFLSHIDNKSTASNDEPTLPFARRKDLLIEIFTEDGRKIQPFACNNNVINGILADMNGDGFVERADSIRYGLQDDWNAEVLTVERVGENPERILAVLFNWGEEDDWDFQFSDQNGDGVVEIEFGPFTEAGVVPRVVFTWSPTVSGYVSSTGKSGDHFRILTQQDVWTELSSLSGSMPGFEIDPLALSKWDRIAYRDGEIPEWKQRAQKAISSPYTYRSLSSLTDEQLFNYMGGGKDLFSVELEESPRTNFPDSFWTMPVQEAVLSLADANRSAEHRNRYKISLDSAEESPPKSMAVAFSSSAGHSGEDPNFFVRASNDSSYFAYAAVSRLNYLDPEESRFDDTQYRFVFCEMSQDEAARIAQGLWLLNRLRTVPDNKTSDDFLFSTGGGTATLMFIPADKGSPTSITAGFNGHVSETWGGPFKPEELMEFAQELFYGAASERLGACGEGLQAWRFEHWQTPKELHKLAALFLDSFSVDQNRISFGVVNAAVRAAGDLVMVDLEPRLRKLDNLLPAPAQDLRCEAEIWAEVDAIDEQKMQPNLANLAEYNATSERKSQLMDEAISIRHGASTRCALSTLKSAVRLSLRQIEAGSDVGMLRSWVLENRDHWHWALARLSKVDPASYAAVLESQLQAGRRSDSVYLLRLLAKANDAKAVRCARSITADDQSPLAVEAFSVLANANNSVEVAKRIPSMIRILTVHDSNFEVRRTIIDAFVPLTDPLRWDDPEIDKVLLSIVTTVVPEGNWSLILDKSTPACALFLRTQALYFSEMLAALDSSGHEAMEVLAVIERMKPQLTASQSASLLGWIRSNFNQTRGPLDNIVLSAWSTDATELRPEVEQLATSSPDDIQGESCNSGSSELRKVSGRCHLARQIASLWNEEDPITRVRLQVSFYLQYPYYFDRNDFSGTFRFELLKTQLSDALLLLPQSQHDNVLKFLDWCNKQHPFDEYNLVYNSGRAELFSFVRVTLEQTQASGKTAPDSYR